MRPHPPPAAPAAVDAASAGAAIAPPRVVVPPLLAAVALSLLLGLQPVSTDFYLPALPMLTRALAAPMPRAQATMSALILCFGLAQLAWGPLSDRVGRRPVLLVGLALFTAAAIGGALAQSIEALVAWRALQGAALAAAVVCARAIVRDLYEPTEGARVMALALGGLGVIALLGPLAGGAAAAWVGWRGPLVLVAAMGVATFATIAIKLPETAPRTRALDGSAGERQRAMALLRDGWAIVRHPTFVAWSLLVACTYGGLFVVLSASSFVYMDVLGLTPTGYGAVMAVGSTVYVAGTVVCRRAIARAGMAAAVRRGAWFTLAGGLLIAALYTAGVHTVWAVLLPQCLYAFGHGHHQPCGQAGVVGPFPRAAGAASALAGLLLALVATGIGRWLGSALAGGTAAPLAWGLAAWAVATAAVAWVLVPRVAR